MAHGGRVLCRARCRRPLTTSVLRPASSTSPPAPFASLPSCPYRVGGLPELYDFSAPQVASPPPPAAASPLPLPAAADTRAMPFVLFPVLPAMPCDIPPVFHNLLPSCVANPLPLPAPPPPPRPPAVAAAGQAAKITVDGARGEGGRGVSMT